MDTQSEDYKVLQAMRTEINGLVESKNRLDLEIQELQRQKAQAELETSAIQTKLNDVGGEWQKKMDALVAKQAEVNNAEIALATLRLEFEKERKEKRDALDYSIAQAKSRESTIQQKEAEIAKKLEFVRDEEKRLGAVNISLTERQDKHAKDLLRYIQDEQNLLHLKREIDEAKKTLSTEEARLRHEDARIKAFEGQISLASSNQRAEMDKREEVLRQREAMLVEREKEIEKQKAVMDTRITKHEAENIMRLKDELAAKTSQLYQERSEFEIQKKNAHQELFTINENINQAKQELASIEGKIADIERREKGVADSEAGLAAKEKQLMFEIAKFKKRVSDAKMEEAINESR